MLLHSYFDIEIWPEEFLLRGKFKKDNNESKMMYTNLKGNRNQIRVGVGYV